jgi:hypothetical protein
MFLADRAIVVLSREALGTQEAFSDERLHFAEQCRLRFSSIRDEHAICRVCFASVAFAGYGERSGPVAQVVRAHP